VNFRKQTRQQRRAHFVAVAAALVAGLGLAACGGAANPPRDPSASRSTTSSTISRSSASAVNKPTRVKFGSGSVGPSDPTTTVPQDLGRPVQPNFGAGTNIIITAAGCTPQTLEANVTSPVVWTNLSGKPQRVVFQSFAVDSGTIPPGGTFTWTTNDALALSYKLLPSGEACKLAMNQPNP
jgi:hypothetical protein